MWSDGSDNDHTNFATDSGLEGEHCCIRTGARGWRGDTCDTLVVGVCERSVGRVLSHPGSLVITSGHGLLAVRQRYSTHQQSLYRRRSETKPHDLLSLVERVVILKKIENLYTLSLDFI